MKDAGENRPLHHRRFFISSDRGAVFEKDVEALTLAETVCASGVRGLTNP